MNWLKRMFVNDDPIIKFKSTIAGYEIGQPVKKASEVKPDWLTIQTKNAEKYNYKKFSACPGMHDYYRAGYIIPAWEDFEIIVDDNGAHINIGKGDHFSCAPYERMSYEVVSGAITIDDDTPATALKLPCPWKVFTKQGYSAFVLPALFHSPFLRDIFPYPGINDYDRYHTINVMFTPLKKMHVKIYAGTPMLQVIPYKREDYTCEVGHITPQEHGLAEFTYRTGLKGFYRKFIHQKKNYDIKYVD